MKTQNIRLIWLAAILLLLNMWLLSSKTSFKQLNFDTDLFAISDTSEIEKIGIKSSTFEYMMSRSSKWRLNDELPSDPSIRKIFFTMLQRIKIARELTGEEQSTVYTRFDYVGTEVVVWFNGGQLAFKVVGNSNQTKTYFLIDEHVYEVEIPGYRDYLASIFELKMDQWRDRLIFNGNWRTIQKMEAFYPEHPERDFSIQFKETFYEVVGLEKIDSSEVVNFLNQFEFLQANERISVGFLSAFDSLSKTAPELVIRLEDIKYKQPIEIRIFGELPGQQIRLVLDQNAEMMVFEAQRIEPFFRTREDFIF